MDHDLAVALDQDDVTGRSDAPLLAQMAACLPNLAPAARAELMAQLISGQQGAHSLLTALETGKVPAALVDAASRTALLNSRQTALKSRAGKLFARLQVRHLAFARGIFRPSHTPAEDDFLHRVFFAQVPEDLHHVRFGGRAHPGGFGPVIG